MIPQEAFFGGSSVERFHDQKPYLDLGTLSPTEHFVLTGVTSHLHEASLADIIVQAIPSVEDDPTFALRFSPDVQDPSNEHPLGTLLAGLYIAKAAMHNVIDRGDSSMYHRVLDEEVENQLIYFRENPAVFSAFTGAIEESQQKKDQAMLDVAPALSHLAEVTRVVKQVPDRDRNMVDVEGYDLSYYPSIGVFLNDLQGTSSQATRIVLSSDSVTAQILYKSSLENASANLLYPDRSSDAIERVDQLLGPLMDVAAEKSQVEKRDARFHLVDFYQLFLNPENGQFEGRLPLDTEFRRFVFGSKAAIIETFFGSTDREYLELTRDYFQQRGQTAEARLILFRLLEGADSSMLSQKVWLLKDYIEECFPESAPVAESLTKFVDKKLNHPETQPRIDNIVLQRVILSLHEEKNIDEISSSQEVMVPNVLYGEYILECLQRYSYLKGDNHARRFLARLDADDFPSEVRQLARSKRDNPVG